MQDERTNFGNTSKEEILVCSSTVEYFHLFENTYNFIKNPFSTESK